MQELSSELVVIAEIHLAEYRMEEDLLESLLLLEQYYNNIVIASVFLTTRIAYALPLLTSSPS